MARQVSDKATTGPWAQWGWMGREWPRGWSSEELLQECCWSCRCRPVVLLQQVLVRSRAMVQAQTLCFAQQRWIGW